MDSLYFFTKAVLGYNKLVDHYHLPFCDRLQVPQPGRGRGELRPRGTYKSTILKAFALWRSLPIGNDYPADLEEKWRVVHNPDLRIAFVGESDTVAQKNLNDIKWHVESNAFFRWLFPEFTFPTGNTKWTTDEIIFPFRSRSYDESSITTLGVGAKRTGFHWDLIIYDDIIGEKASVSEALMEGAWSWFQYASGMLVSQQVSEEVFIGTRWKHGTADIYGKVMEQMPSNSERGFEWHTSSIVEPDEDGVEKSVFPEEFPDKVIEAIRRRLGEYKFNCQYMNRPSSPEGSDFPPQDLRDYSISDDRKTLLPTDGTPPVRLSQLMRATFLDPSAGGRSAQCEAALATCGMAPDGRVFVLHSWGKNCGFGEQLEQMHRVNDRFLPTYNRYEQVGAQKALEDVEKERKGQVACRFCLLQGRKNVIHRHMRLEGVKPPQGAGEQSKHERIRAFLGPFVESNRLYLGPNMHSLRTQILEFPHGALVDRLDALAYCVKQLYKPTSQDELEAQTSDLERFRSNMGPYTKTEYDYGGM